MKRDDPQRDARADPRSPAQSPRSPVPPSQPDDIEGMWTLDMALAALAGLVLYLIVTRLSFHDPRPLYNGWTYVTVVPIVALLLALSLRSIASKYIQKSLQLGFLFSVLLHLLLLILAINVVIFSRYFPDAFAGVKPERSPIRKTVPEYLFQSPEESTTSPDWSRPVEVETRSRIVPQEQRVLPPLQKTKPKLEVPQPQQPRQVQLQRYLMRRQQPTQSQPQPADSPAKLARRDLRIPSAPMTQQSPQAPTVPVQPDSAAQTVERQVNRQRQQQSASAQVSAVSAAPAPVAAGLAVTTSTDLPVIEARSRSTEMPRVGESGLASLRQQRDRATRIEPAGAAPAPQTVAVAAVDSASQRMLSPTDIATTRRSQAAGAQLIDGVAPSSLLATADAAASGAEIARNQNAARIGMPNITAGSADRLPGQRNRLSSAGKLEALGTPSSSGAAPAAASADTGLAPGNPSASTTSEQIPDRSSELATDRRSTPGGQRSRPSQVESSASGPVLDLLADLGPAGLGDRVSPVTGIVPSAELPEVSALQLNPDPRPRREVGGPTTPAGTEIAAVESFSRRVMRTQGGAAPTPAGQVGPATEKAIERGLTYLANIQNEDGSWSLQGHGDDVLLQSDTAATGLCLLAFQGAGYTHRQHQYADTVSRGLQFLLQNQRTNGDLFRPENQLSNRNVALYSHGIAALALCEAYGMTQDPELKAPAQDCLRYIIETQHYGRGGWRYAPQVSSDTSVSGWMMMSLKSGELSGLDVPKKTYDGIDKWLNVAQTPGRPDRYRYNPYAPDTPTQRHGRVATPTMTAVGILMRMYSGWQREQQEMKSAADYLLQFPPRMGDLRSPQRDAYYWYYATQVMFHMGGEHWEQWNRYLNPLLLESQIRNGPLAGSWDPAGPVPDRWSQHGGRLYVTTMNLLNLEVFYRHLPIYDDTAE